MTSTHIKHALALLACAGLLTGCGAEAGNVTYHGNGTATGNDTQPANQARAAGAVYQVNHSTYDASHQKVTLYVSPISEQPKRASGDLIDVGSSDGLINYATASYPSKPVREVRVSLPNESRPMAGLATQDTSRLADSWRIVIPDTLSRPVGPTSSTAVPGAWSTSAAGSRVQIPPPGVRMDRYMNPAADASEPVAAKTQAVLSVARSKIGTPYIWGHNEDRGQFGFDCSNFTEYVYHHALGYLMTTSSRGQYAFVGLAISKSQMQPGDLVIFERGRHVGIYAGNNRVIQEGGGLRRVGYLSIAPNTYWGRNITVVKRLF